MVWPTLGTRTAKEQNRTLFYLRTALGLAAYECKSSEAYTGMPPTSLLELTTWSNNCPLCMMMLCRQLQQFVLKRCSIPQKNKRTFLPA